MEGRENILEIKDLQIGYHRKTIFAEGLSFSLFNGELTTLLGLNGIGKSTLLKTIVRLIPAINGSIMLSGKELGKTSVSEQAKKIAYVSTENIQVNHLTVFELVSQGRYPYTGWHGKLTTFDRDCVKESLSLVGLEGFHNRFINELSDGERQRAMIARAIAQDTPVIILDEPSAYLDLKNRYEVIALLHKLAHEKNKAVLFSSHDLSIVLKETDRIILLEKAGVTIGAPEDLVLNGTIDRLFVNTRISFDKQRADFVINREFTRKVALRGNELYCKWTENALNRIGYCVDNQCSELIIEIKDSNEGICWELVKKSEKKIYFTTSDLILALSK
ncbi:MAG: hypothetical protein A2W91_19195 [Bacteroidetes bacterium GWF2_38_335]|nr:MAG: hypothetical protein A2W91_19195 [Bacteroidetes bacterium GWF2_38_335]OFY79886.1 MAG: hypothetical protein A2281_10595 [Bacteroidetes bacterium RIFOXYA12_FULL_38_20]HBS86341.1 ABC transporter ATP-binding protein [Bacteroidales bacterium]